MCFDAAIEGIKENREVTTIQSSLPQLPQLLQVPPLPQQPETIFSRAVRQHLLAVRNEFNTDLIDAYLKEESLETQVNIRTDIGKPRSRKLPCGKTFKCRVDGHNIFANLRYPRNAATVPEWDESPTVRWPLSSYAEAIGTTWFSESGSRRLGYDVDSVWGHKGKRTLTDTQLDAVRLAIERVDYIELRRSTSGRGLHLYLLLMDVLVSNHTEHAALARALLGMLCHDTGLDFSPQIDCLGSNMWIWSRRATPENRGFELLKPATRTLVPDDLPPNWRDHLDVVTRRRTRVRVPGVDEDSFSEMAGACKVALDDEHKRIIAALEKAGYTFVYTPDYNCYHGHTAALAKVHKELGLRGFFETTTPDTDPATPNCYFFLRQGGVFFVVRFTTQDEHDSWGRTTTGERCCYYNCPLDLRTACGIVKGIWTGKACTCHTHAQAKQFATMFDFSLPPLGSDRAINFRYQDAHTIMAETASVKGEKADGWGMGYRTLIVTFAVEAPPIPEHDFDSVVRHIITSEKENAGFVMRSDDGEWIFEPKGTVEDRLARRFDLSSKDMRKAMGSIVGRPYVLVNEPFQPEFYAGRRWNKFGAQLAVAPTYGGRHEHYDKILRHIGKGLDAAVENDPWCQQHHIKDGYAFVRLWCAVLFRNPAQHLPMLYLYSEKRDNGKSALHKALGLLFKRGYVEGVRMLNEQFNKLLAGAVLVYLDEEKVEVRSAQKVKLYIDADQASIRMMRTDTFMFANRTHWIAAYNFKDGVPVEDGDKRIIMVHVPILFDDEKDDWNDVMCSALEAERSDFLGSLWQLDLPPSGNRLYLPVLSTPLKEEVMAADRKADKASLDIKELLARVLGIMSKRRTFIGKTRDLLNLLGPGSWDKCPNQVRKGINSIKDELLMNHIRLDLSDEKLIVMEIET